MAIPTNRLVEDLYSRKIIGWAFGKIMDAELAVKLLRNAALNVKHTEEIIIQSDMEVIIRAIFLNRLRLN